MYCENQYYSEVYKYQSYIYHLTIDQQVFTLPTLIPYIYIYIYIYIYMLQKNIMGTFGNILYDYTKEDTANRIT
jgi:hypothetical protein